MSQGERGKIVVDPKDEPSALDAGVEVFLRDEVRSHWKEYARGIMLSALGLRLRRTFPDAPKYMPEGLQRYLEGNGIAQIVKHPVIAGQEWAVPIEVAGNAPAPVTIPPQSGRKSYGKFPRELWQAFFKQIEARRFVLFSESGEYLETIDAPSPPAEGKAIEILPSDVGRPEEALQSDRILKNRQRITAWIERNGINPDKLLLPSAAQVKPELGTGDLARAIAVLSPQDLSRISIPLDIVMKMIGQR